MSPLKLITHVFFSKFHAQPSHSNLETKHQVSWKWQYDSRSRWAIKQVGWSKTRVVCKDSKGRLGRLRILVEKNKSEMQKTTEKELRGARNNTILTVGLFTFTSIPLIRHHTLTNAISTTSVRTSFPPSASRSPSPLYAPEPQPESPSSPPPTISSSFPSHPHPPLVARIPPQCDD